MKELEKGESQIQKICDMLRRETLEPALKEAEQIIEDANKRASELISKAEKDAVVLLERARKTREQEMRVFDSSLEQGVKLALESLRQSIESSLFNASLSNILERETADPKLIAKLIEAIVKAIERGGIGTDLTAIVPKAVSADEINRLIAEDILKKLKDKSVQIGDFSGGAKVKLHDRRMTIDVSDAALKELLADYVRKDFRKLIFAQ